jgi:hypothetical protein
MKSQEPLAFIDHLLKDLLLTSDFLNINSIEIKGFISFLHHTSLTLLPPKVHLKISIKIQFLPHKKPLPPLQPPTKELQEHSDSLLELCRQNTDFF